MSKTLNENLTMTKAATTDCKAKATRTSSDTGVTQEGMMSRGLSDVAILGVIALMVIFHVADGVSCPRQGFRTVEGCLNSTESVQAWDRLQMLNCVPA